jgi:phosphate transport system substrate-binding protein
MIVAITDPESDEAVIKTPGSLGAAGLPSILAGKTPVKIISLNGIRPSLATLANGTYPLAKDIRFITTRRISPEATKLLDFIYSTKGRAISEKSGVLVSKGGI